MNYKLIEVETNGDGGRDGHYERAISDDKEKLIKYCEETFEKKVGKPDIFSWDNYFIIEETKIVIL